MKEYNFRITGRITATLILLILIICGGVVAYLTDRDSADNVFTVGNLEIAIEEPSFDTEEADNLYPGKVVGKDPAVVNRDEVDAFVFMEVRIPMRNVYLVGKDGKSISKARTELFTTDFSSRWTLMAQEENPEEDCMVYLFVYGREESPEVLQGREGDVEYRTEPLFTEAAFANILEGELDEKGLSIPVTAYGIQASSLEDKTAGEIFSILCRQLETAPDVEPDYMEEGEDA